MFDGRVGAGMFIQALPTIVEAVCLQESSTPPLLDRVGLNVQPLGHLGQTEHSSCAQSLVSTVEVVVAANPVNDLQAEREALPRA